MNRYFLGLLAIIILFVILIILAIPGGNHKVPSTHKSLISYASTGAVASLTIEGPVNANSQHQGIRIDVSRNNVTYYQLAGYNGRVVTQQSFSNTEASYDVFLHALYYSGFTEGDTNPSLSDEKGVCSLGDTYVFELKNGGNDIERFWATNCNGTHTYKGNTSQTITLFENQVPNYSQLSQNVIL